jgi:hypothetical protein
MAGASGFPPVNGMFVWCYGLVVGWAVVAPYQVSTPQKPAKVVEDRWGAVEPYTRPAEATAPAGDPFGARVLEEHAVVRQ